MNDIIKEFLEEFKNSKTDYDARMHNISHLLKFDKMKEYVEEATLSGEEDVIIDLDNMELNWDYLGFIPTGVPIGDEDFNKAFDDIKDEIPFDGEFERIIIKHRFISKNEPLIVCDVNVLYAIPIDNAERYCSLMSQVDKYPIDDAGELLGLYEGVIRCTFK